MLKFYEVMETKETRVIFQKNNPNQKCGYWLSTPNQQFVLKLIYFNSNHNHKSPTGQLQNNSMNCATLITMNRVIIFTILRLL